MRDLRDPPQLKVLIADDDPLIRDSISEMLIEIGFFVRSAQDGVSALVEIRKVLPDILRIL